MIQFISIVGRQVSEKNKKKTCPQFQLVLDFLYGARRTTQLVLNFLYGAETKFCIFVWEAQLGLAQEVGESLYGSSQVKNFKVLDSQSSTRLTLHHCVLSMDCHPFLDSSREYRKGDFFHG